MGAKIKDLGPCGALFDNVDLGATFGGVSFKFTEESKPVKEDQSGITEVDGIMVGATCEVTVPMSRSSLVQLAKVIGGSSYSGNRLYVGAQVGTSLLDNAKILILKPIVGNVVSADNSTWLTFAKAYPIVDMDVSYSNEGQRVYKVIFKVFPSGGKLWKIGA